MSMELHTVQLQPIIEASIKPTAPVHSDGDYAIYRVLEHSLIWSNLLLQLHQGVLELLGYIMIYTALETP